MARVSNPVPAPFTDRDERALDLLQRLSSARSPRVRQRLFDEVVVLHLDLCESLARRYANRGIDLDDLVQVARVGLVCAVQRFRQEAGNFVPFAVATITGEIKRHFRSGWMIRPPRRLQELKPDDDGPRSAEREGLALAFRPLSLDAASPTGEAPAALQLPAEDPDLELLPDLVTLHSAMRRLGPLERRVLHLRFVEDLAQADIGRRLGVSQMQVSRILSRVLADLRQEMGSEAA
ncbi:sigma-70 family RNA polymerase sigma factor [Tessaracoccus sp. Z1128]